MKRFLLFFLLILFLFSTSSCNRQRKYSEEIWGYFDTVVEVSGYFDSEEDFYRAVKTVKDSLKFYNELLNIYEDSEKINLKDINESNGKEIDISVELFDFLAFFKKTEAQTEGACKMAFGTVTSLWKKTIASETPIPTNDELLNASAHTDCDSIKLLAEPYRVVLSDTAVRIDPGAVAKGWVGEKIKEALSREGFDNLIVNMGGHVIAIGEKKDGEKWVVGIRNPNGGTYTTVKVSDKSVVTSGVYERGREIDGTLYHHIISPNTLYPASHFASVTVIADNSALADALSTALFVSRLETGLGILERFPDVSALWIYSDGTEYRTDNFPK